MSDKPREALSPTYRRTPTLSKKKKASRSERISSESLQSLYDQSADHGDKTQEEDDDVPESERFLNSTIDHNRWDCNSRVGLEKKQISIARNVWVSVKKCSLWLLWVDALFDEFDTMLKLLIMLVDWLWTVFVTSYSTSNTRSIK